MAGVGTGKMKQVLAVMSSDAAIPLPRLAEKLQMGESNLRRVLADMKELGLVVQVLLPRPKKRSYATPHTKFCQFGWQKTVLVAQGSINSTEVQR
jgi:DNA-binding transcriptional regulator GbsR (MarR family)